MSPWKGVVAPPFSADAFDAYVTEITLGEWRPQFVVLHNTQIPMLGEWRNSTGAEHMNALVEYYRDQPRRPERVSVAEAGGST